MSNSSNKHIESNFLWFPKRYLKQNDNAISHDISGLINNYFVEIKIKLFYCEELNIHRVGNRRR